MKREKRATVAKSPNTKLEIQKLVGTGNDFIFVDLRSKAQMRAWKSLVKNKSRGRVAKQICRRQEGVGADGLVILEPRAGVHFIWDFYNSDGSHAEMCGNASRCAVLLAAGSLKEEIVFDTKIGAIRGKVRSENYVQVQLPLPRMVKEKMSIFVKGKKILGDFINSGVPHFVVRAHWSPGRYPNRELSLDIQNHRAFGSKKTNVTYVSPKGKNKFKTVTFERGVFDYTKSCGTGALAAGFSLTKKSGGSVRLETPGGELQVIFDRGEGFCRLLGPAQKTFLGYVG
jgi:diaminopimelate epimerase